ncbi:hypothetical protein B0H14DRAFT_2643507 [Mycena olivaceomarginata]|nr:hypothetical protein B0H14DRAFT_2643507 [Mycena olivaceomarginata]
MAHSLVLLCLVASTLIAVYPSRLWLSMSLPTLHAFDPLYTTSTCVFTGRTTSTHYLTTISSHTQLSRRRGDRCSGFSGDWGFTCMGGEVYGRGALPNDASLSVLAATAYSKAVTPTPTARL